MAGFAARNGFAGHPRLSAKTRHALRLKPDHPIEQTTPQVLSAQSVYFPYPRGY